ncbi:MAG: hypothetical protein ABIL05_04590, partial [candidate division WOR-3 bacterium]
MLILIYFTLLTFFQDYQHFVDTRKADQLLVEFGRDTTNYAILENDPVKIWFIRNHFPNEKIESLMVATRPFPRQPEISSVLRYEALRANDYKTKIRKLKQAWQLDPYAFDNFLSLLALSLKLKEKILAQETLLNLPEIIKDFQVQVLLLTNVILVIYLVLIGLGFLYIAVQLYRYFPLFAHRLGFLNHGLKDFVGAALLLTPLILFLNIYLLVVIYSVFLLLILNGRARNWLRLFLVLILFSLPLSYPLSIFADFLQRRARTYELYSYLKITYPEPKMKFTRPDELFIAAYSLKKRNLLEGAQALYEDLLPHASNSYA